MSKFQWTKEQENAINTRGKNILVAAAAGSGKTAVLVDRIRKMVSEEGIPISEFLVVTFTKAAASEMKEKLRKSIKGELSKEGIDQEKIRYLKRQLVDLETANISTFHSFGLSVIKRFFYKLDMEPGLGIVEDAEKELMKDQAVELLLEKEFEEFRDDFVEFMDSYSSDRNLYKIIALIKDGHNSLMSLPHPWAWMEKIIQETETLDQDFEHSELWGWMRQDLAEKIKKVGDIYRAVVDTLREEGYDKFADKFDATEIAAFDAAYDVVVNSKERPWEIHGKIKALLDYKGSVINPGKDDYYKEAVKPAVESLRSIAKRIIDSGIKKSYFSYDLKDMLVASAKTAPALKTLMRLVKSFDEIYRDIKNEAKVIDFSDIEHYCIQVLEDEEVSEYYRNHFSHIVIDEYQDTNFVQDTIISMIKRENNLFMVGDIKQSIYRFRLAEPALFQEKYAEYKKEGENGLSTVIDLNQNHRSKQPIIDYVNKVFEPIMEGYDEDAKLYCGDEYHGELNQEPIIHVVTLADTESEDVVDETDDVTKEALLIGKIIKENLGKPFYDSKADPPGPRPLEPKDIVILRRSISSYAPKYREILKTQGLDAQIQGEEGYFDTVEIGMFVDLLTVIDNSMRDVPLIGVLHSEIFGFTAEELAEIRLSHKEDRFYDAFKKYGREADTELAERCRGAMDRILAWREMSRTMDIPKFIRELMIESGTYAIMGALPNGNQRQSNLRELCNIAERFISVRQGILYDFIKYIESIKAGEIKIPEAQEAMNIDNAVNIMTIHKSKGLEYPMVILAGGTTALSGRSKPLAFHKDIGVGLEYVDKEQHWRVKSLMQHLISMRKEKEEADERIRLLYVALTRARDRLFVTAFSPKCKFKEAAENGIYNYGNFLEMMAPSVPYEIEYFDLPDETVPAASEEPSAEVREEGGFEVLSQEEIKGIESILKYKYPHIKARKLKSKYSVSELNKERIAQEEKKAQIRAPRRISFDEEAPKLTVAERGTVYHTIMENLSFASFDGLEGEVLSNKVQGDIEEMVRKGILADFEAQAIDPSKICGFFEADLGRRCIKAQKNNLLEKERPFTLRTEKDGVEILVQGIIDCYFHEEIEGSPGEYKTVLLDYKSNWIDSSKPLEEEEERLRREYIGQMELYKTALEKAGMGKIDEAYLYLLDIGHGFLV